MCDREARDLARREKKGTPTPKKALVIHKNSENKENEGKTCRVRLNYSEDGVKSEEAIDETEKDDSQERVLKSSFDHPVYKEI